MYFILVIYIFDVIIVILIYKLTKDNINFGGSIGKAACGAHPCLLELPCKGKFLFHIRVRIAFR